MNIATCSLLKSFVINLFLSIIKIIFGFIGKSSALIADGLHSFSDLATDAVSLFGAHYSLKPADEEHPYGHGRFEYLTCLIIGIVVLFLGFEIIVSSFKNENVIPSRLVILISIFTIIVKHILARYLIKIGSEINNQILISSGKESKMDVISSLFVLLSSILMQFSEKYNILVYSNLIATIIVGILILKTGSEIIKDNFSSILGETECLENIELMKSVISKEKKIDKIDEFIVLKNGPYLQIVGEVSMDGKLSLNEVHSILERIENNIKKLDNRAYYINIHVNPSSNIMIKNSKSKNKKRLKSEKK